MGKVIKNGMVAVLYSPGFGAGWYSWNGDFVECLFDPEIVNLVLDGLLDDDELDRDVVNQIEKLANEKWTGFYAGGARDLQVKWVAQGEQFEVTEYDGSERVNVIGECQYLIA